MCVCECVCVCVVCGVVCGVCVCVCVCVRDCLFRLGSINKRPRILQNVNGTEDKKLNSVQKGVMMVHKSFRL